MGKNAEKEEPREMLEAVLQPESTDAVSKVASVLGDESLPEVETLTVLDATYESKQEEKTEEKGRDDNDVSMPAVDHRLLQLLARLFGDQPFPSTKTLATTRCYEQDLPIMINETEFYRALEKALDEAKKTDEDIESKVEDNVADDKTVPNDVGNKYWHYIVEAVTALVDEASKCQEEALVDDDFYKALEESMDKSSRAVEKALYDISDNYVHPDIASHSSNTGVPQESTPQDSLNSASNEDSLKLAMQEVDFVECPTNKSNEESPFHGSAIDTSAPTHTTDSNEADTKVNANLFIQVMISSEDPETEANDDIVDCASETGAPSAIVAEAAEVTNAENNASSLQEDFIATATFLKEHYKSINACFHNMLSSSSATTEDDFGKIATSLDEDYEAIKTLFHKMLSSRSRFIETWTETCNVALENSSDRKVNNDVVIRNLAPSEAPENESNQDTVPFEDSVTDDAAFPLQILASLFNEDAREIRASLEEDFHNIKGIFAPDATEDEITSPKPSKATPERAQDGFITAEVTSSGNKPEALDPPDSIQDSMTHVAIYSNDIQNDNPTVEAAECNNTSVQSMTMGDMDDKILAFREVSEFEDIQGDDIVTFRDQIEFEDSIIERHNKVVTQKSEPKETSDIEADKTGSDRDDCIKNMEPTKVETIDKGKSLIVNSPADESPMKEPRVDKDHQDSGCKATAPPKTTSKLLFPTKGAKMWRRTVRDKSSNCSSRTGTSECNSTMACSLDDDTLSLGDSSLDSLERETDATCFIGSVVDVMLDVVFGPYLSDESSLSSNDFDKSRKNQTVLATDVRRTGKPRLNNHRSKKGSFFATEGDSTDDDSFSSIENEECFRRAPFGKNKVM